MLLRPKSGVLLVHLVHLLQHTGTGKVRVCSEHVETLRKVKKRRGGRFLQKRPALRSDHKAPAEEVHNARRAH